MTSPPPLEYGQTYHIYNRGNNRANIFIEERNYRYFLQLYVKHVEPIADTYAYCLLRNHFHLLVRIKTVVEQEQTLRVSETLRVSTNVFRPKRPSQQFGNLFNAYAKAINKAYERTGSLFQNPFGRIAVKSDTHFARLIAYIHRNPQKHGFVTDFGEWPYSSYQAILSSKPTRVKRDRVLAWFDGPDAFRTVHLQAIEDATIAPLIGDDFD
jgi:REP element-mobilizing transposase RayT